METYAERLQKRKESEMTNYDMDEIERQRERERKSRGIRPENQSVEIGKGEEPWTAVDIEIEDEDFMKIAREAHDRDITLNQLVNNVLRDSLKNLEYKFEHGNKPILLTENK